MENYTEYQFLIFSQLFYLIAVNDEDDAPYDITYPIVVDELNKFLVSDFNDLDTSEYDAMHTYLLANADSISLRVGEQCD